MRTIKRMLKPWQQMFRMSLVAALAMMSISTASASEPAATKLACAAPGDSCWASGYHVPGVTGEVYALALDAQGNLYVGGEIISAGGIPVGNVAKWDGVEWSDLGGGMSHSTSTPYVAALAVDGSGNLYAGGFFSQAGGASADNLAKWDGATWSEVGGGVNGGVTALELESGSALYVGGSFSMVGSLPAQNIARWNFGNWSALGSGVDDTVYALELDLLRNTLYAGGDFANAGGNPALRVAGVDIDSSVWFALGGGMDTGGTVYSLAVEHTSGDLYAGGAFPSAGGVSSPCIAVWKGSPTGWQTVGGGTDGTVTSLRFNSGGDLFAGGEFTQAGGSPALHVAKWSGSAWSALSSGVGDAVVYEQVSALLLDGAENVIVGGRFEQAEGLWVNNLARWPYSGSAWSGVDGGQGLNSITDALAFYGSTLFAAGGFSTAGPISAVGAARWGGSSWAALGSAPGYIHDIATPDGVTLYAGGAFSSAGSAPADNIARWNGSAWAELGGGTDGYVHALALDGGGGLYAGGVFTAAGGVPAAYIAYWNGVVWSPLGDGLDGEVTTLAVDDQGNLYAGGKFHYAGDLFVNHIAMWDGTKWSALGGGVDDWVYALETDGDGRLYAGGYFVYAGGVSANFVAMWNGLEWSALGDGMDGAVGALEVDSNGYLYAGGEFDQAGGDPASRLARWDGFNWSGLGSGVNGNVRALALSSDGLYAGGYFSRAGGVPSANIGLYSLPPAQPAPAPALLALSPGAIAFGGPDLTLTATGVSFSSRTVLRWNGEALATTYVDGQELRALVPAAKIAQPGSVSVTVYTPDAPGSGESAPVTFTVEESYRVFLPSVNNQ